MDADTLIEEYQNGIDAYWAGDVPDGWQDPDLVSRSPFLSGWYQASIIDTGGHLVGAGPEEYEWED